MTDSGVIIFGVAAILIVLGVMLRRMWRERDPADAALDVIERRMRRGSGDNMWTVEEERAIHDRIRAHVRRRRAAGAGDDMWTPEEEAELHERAREAGRLSRERRDAMDRIIGVNPPPDPSRRPSRPPPPPPPPPRGRGEFNAAEVAEAVRLHRAAQARVERGLATPPATSENAPRATPRLGTRGRKRNVE